jgi:hypothetical protein
VLQQPFQGQVCEDDASFGIDGSNAVDAAVEGGCQAVAALGSSV